MQVRTSSDLFAVRVVEAARTTGDPSLANHRTVVALSGGSGVSTARWTRMIPPIITVDLVLTVPLILRLRDVARVKHLWWARFPGFSNASCCKRGPHGLCASTRIAKSSGEAEAQPA